MGVSGFMRKNAVLLAWVLGISIFGIAPALAIPPTVGTFAAISTTWGPQVEVTIIPPTSNSLGAWSYTSSNLSVATVSGGTLNILSVGTSTITATQAASGEYDSVSKTTTLTVNGAAPTIGLFAAISRPLDQGAFTITAPTSNSAGAWSYTSSNVAVATTNGTTFTPVSTGTTTITATQAANWNWAAATVTTTLTVTGGTPTLGAFNDLTLTLGSIAQVTLIPPTSNSSGSWSFSTSNPAVATISGSQLIPIAVGTATITATQAASGNFGAVTKTMTLRIQGGPPTLGAFTGLTAALQPFAANTLTITPPISTSNGTWTFVSSDPTVASVSGNIATLLKIGTTTITATQAASGNFGASNPVTTSLTVTGASPSLGPWSNIEKKVEDSEFSLTPPTSPSAGAWTFSSSNPAVASVTGDRVKILDVGQTVITAKQAANWNWMETSSQITLTILGTTPTIGAFGPIEAGVGDSPLSIVAPSSNSSGTWTFTSSNPAVATVVEGKLNIIGPGISTITAIQNAAGKFGRSSSIATSVTVKPRANVGEFSNISATFGDPAKSIIAPTSTSPGAWSYSSSNPSVVSIVGNSMNFLGAGTATISARQAGTDSLAPTNKTFSITVAPKTPTLGSYSDVKVKFSSEPISIPVPISNSTGLWTFTLADSSLGTITDGKLTAQKVGFSVIRATQSASGNYAGISISAILTVTPAVSATLKGRTITISLQGASGIVTINGKKAKIGANKVLPGTRNVLVRVDGNVILKKSFKVK